MTTIVWKAPYFAADRRVTDDAAEQTTKIRRFVDAELGPCLYASAGLWNPGVRFYEWLSGGRKGRCPGTAALDVLIVLRRELRCEQWASDRGKLIRTPIVGYTAIGSGHKYALGALYVGASVRDAIKAATAHDTLTGNGIQVVKA